MAVGQKGMLKNNSMIFNAYGKNMLSDILERCANCWLKSLERRKLPMPYWHGWFFLVSSLLLGIVAYFKHKECILGFCAISSLAFAFYFLLSEACWRRISELKRQIDTTEREKE